MIAVKGKYDGTSVTLEQVPVLHECEVIVTFLDPPSKKSTVDDGSLSYLFRNYRDDGKREQIIDFGEAIGDEQW